MRIEHSNGYKGGVTSRRRPAAVADPVLDRVVAEDLAERQHGVAKLEAVLDWVHAHPGTPGDCASWDPALLTLDAEGWIEDRLDHLGGDGTPAVAEFAVEQLAASLGLSTGVAMQLVADTVDLAYRHPLLWGRVRTGGVPVWIARKIAAACSGLPVEAAGWVDTQTAQVAGRVPWRRIEAKIAYAVATWDPQAAKDAEAQARDSRQVEVSFPTRGPDGCPARPGDIATADLRGRLSAIDAIKFDALVAAKAAELAAGGDTDPLDVRRSKALGLIADQLITGELDLTSCGTQQASCLPATLYVHVNADDLAARATGDTAGPGIGVVEKLGPATLDLLAGWLAQTDLTIRPVLDMSRTDAVDQHDPPAWMRELVVLRDRHCVFPHCNRPARTCDLDHLDPYIDMDDGGPPGQTSPENLAPLCRRHHRCKTFTRWRYHRLPTGDYEWTDPSGHHFTAPL